MKTIVNVLRVFGMAALFGVLGFGLGYGYRARTEPTGPTVTLLSPGQLQQVLNALEPSRDKLTVDYKTGPKTLSKWDRVYCNMQGVEAWEKATKK